MTTSHTVHPSEKVSNPECNEQHHLIILLLDSSGLSCLGDPMPPDLKAEETCSSCSFDTKEVVAGPLSRVSTRGVHREVALLKMSSLQPEAEAKFRDSPDLAEKIPFLNLAQAHGSRYPSGRPYLDETDKAKLSCNLCSLLPTHMINGLLKT